MSGNDAINAYTRFGRKNFDPYETLNETFLTTDSNRL